LRHTGLFPLQEAIKVHPAVDSSLPQFTIFFSLAWNRNNANLELAAAEQHQFNELTM